VASQELDEMDGARGTVDPIIDDEPATRAQLTHLTQKARGHYKNADELRRKLDDELTKRQIGFEKREEEVKEQQRELADARNKHDQALKEHESVKRANLIERGRLQDREKALTERELNAEAGFVKQKEEAFGSLEDQIKERKAALASLAREHLEERSRAEQLLRSDLASRRQHAESDWSKEEAARLANLEEKAMALEARERQLTEKEAEQRRQRLDLSVGTDLLREERAAANSRVERLVDEKVESLRHELASTKEMLAQARKDRDAHHTQLEARREMERRQGGRPLDELVTDFQALEVRCRELEAQLRVRPATKALERLDELESERAAWLDERTQLKADFAKANRELATRRLAAIELETLKQQNEALEVHKKLLDQAVKELRVQVNELTRQDDSKNPMASLSGFDTPPEFQVSRPTTSPFAGGNGSLSLFAQDLRHRLARGIDGRTLFYAERDVRTFLGGLAMGRLMLLQGISGTGKTSLPLAFANAVGGGVEVVEVQAGWRDRQDLVGYYNAFHRHYYATNFLQALYKAGTPAWKDRPFLIVLDEINLSRPEQFFADFLSALEQPADLRLLTLLNDALPTAPRLMVEGRKLPIPPNVWFVGTANHDESTTEFADKTLDRALLMEMPRKTDEAHFEIRNPGHRDPISFEGLENAFAAACERQRPKADASIAWLQKAKFAETLQRDFRIGWGNRLEDQLRRYLPVVVECDGKVGEALDHLLVTKIFRKLKDRHDIRAESLRKLREGLLQEWSFDGDPTRSLALIDAEISAKLGGELA
jgi:hypothetical protein